MIYSEAQQEQSISCSMHILWSSHGWENGPSLEAYHWHMQEGGCQIKRKDIGYEFKRRYNSSNGNYACRDSQFSFDGKWDFNYCICLNVIMYFEGKRDESNDKGSHLKSLKAFYEPARLSDLEQYQLNLALLCAMIAGGVPFNFVKTYHFQE